MQGCPLEEKGIAPKARHGGFVKSNQVASADYFHKVVDCQWACPAHSRPRIHPVDRGGPLRRRLHDQLGFRTCSPEFSGRTCDRPCEPACRRGRVEDELVAICRLKRVAADFKDDVKARIKGCRPRRRTASASPASAAAPLR